MSILKSELKTKNFLLKNRLVMPPMATAKSTSEGFVTEDIINYYDDKTKNKLIPLVIVEHCYVEPRGKASENQLSIDKDECIEGLKKLVDLLHKNDTIAVAQLAHAGSSALESVIGEQPIGPSSMKNPSRPNSELPRELSKDEIKEIIDSFSKAALRAKESGFDAVEIHSAHAYFLNQFLSPITNKRDDEFGGVILNRIRIHTEIIKSIRRKLGEDYPILIRIGAGDFDENGLNKDDLIHAVRHFESLGVEIIDVSGGMCSYRIIDSKPGYFAELSKEIKNSVDIPVILTGGIKTAEDAEKFLKNGDSDLIGIGRALLQNSNWAETELEKIK